MRALTAIPIALLLSAGCSPRVGNEASNQINEVATAPTPAPGDAARAYPATGVLDAFRAACSDLTSLPAAEQRIAAGGWTRIADPATTPVGELVAFGRTEGARVVEGRGRMLNDPTVFGQVIAGEQLYLVLSGVVMDGTRVLGCRLYDVGETRRIAPATVSAWLGRQPARVVDRPELQRADWEPGMAEGQDSLELYFVPAGSPVIEMVKIAGVALAASRIDTE